MKKFFRLIHLYLGLASGLIIAVVCFTGAIMVFEKEMLHTIYTERYFVSLTGNPKLLPLDEIITQTELKLPKSEILYIKTYGDPSRTVEITYKKKEAKSNLKMKETEGKKGKKPEVRQVFINPYTAEVAGHYFIKESFFKKVEMIHRKIFAEEIGKQIVCASVILFVFILITGIILWWPKNKSLLKQGLKIKLNGNWKRTNHDLHTVIGFYASIFLLVIALTGLTFSYKWMENAIFQITGTDSKRPEPIKTKSVGGKILYQSIYLDLKIKYPEAEFFQFKFPQEETDAIAVSVLPENSMNENARDILYYERTGQQIGKLEFNQLNTGHQIKSAMLPIHKGEIGGIFGKILAFMVAIAGFTFPITGIIIWINRINKKKKGIVSITFVNKKTFKSSGASMPNQFKSTPV